MRGGNQIREGKSKMLFGLLCLVYQRYLSPAFLSFCWRQFIIIVMNRQFSTAYDQTIILIKQLKNSNDSLNRVIGVDPPNTVTIRLRQEAPTVQNNISTIESFIVKLEQSYLDPDTARKIGNAKQQFRIQKDRRKQLVNSVDEERGSHYSKTSQITELSLTEGSERKNSFEGSPSTVWERNSRKVSQDLSPNGGSFQMQREDELPSSYQMEHKIMRERGEQIDHMSRNLLNVHNIINQTSVLAHEQGQQLDIIGQDLFTAYKGVRQAREQLNEANEHQKKAKRKYVMLSLIVLLLAAVALGLVLA